MFSLLVTVVAVVLVAVMAIAGIYYGGSVFQTGSIRAVADQFVNAGVQIDGAQALHQTDTGSVLVDDATNGTAVDGLVSQGYLSAVPAVPSQLVEAGATWTYAIPPGGTRPVLALALDDSKSATAAFCAEVAKTQGFACTSDLATVGAAQ